jgi:hypothetical protein
MKHAKFFLPVAFVLLVCCENAMAQDPEFCSSLTRAANQAQVRFSGFRTGPKDEFGDYESKFSFPGSTCLVSTTDGAEFVCSWRLGIEHNAKNEASNLADGIAACFPSAKRSASQSVPRIAAHRFRLNGVMFRIGFDANRNRVRLGIERDSD